MLVAILPPLLYSAAFFTSLRDLRRNIRPLSLLAIGLVLVTMLSVAAVCHAAISGLSWPVCFVLGALVAPTDAVAANAIASRLGIPRRLVTLIEGESLINDATALVAYRFAVAAVVTGSFSLWHATWHFVVDVVGGIGDRPRGRVRDPPDPAAARPLSDRDRDRAPLRLLRLPAGRGGRRLGGARGRDGRHLRRLVHARADDRRRRASRATRSGSILTFLLNALLFGLVGLQLRPILDSLSGRSTGDADRRRARSSAAAVIVTRLLWIYPATYVPRFLFAPDPRARPVPAVAVPDASSAGPACAARSRSPPRSRCR